MSDKNAASSISDTENQQGSAEITRFQLEQFEYLVNTDQQELAARELLFLLHQLDNNYGLWGDKVNAFVPGQTELTLNAHVCTRLAGAITTLFSRPQFNISDDGFAQLMNLHRWLGLIFAVSGYRHADHIIRNHNAAGGGIIDPLTLNANNLKLYCLCYHLDSEIALQPDVLWQYDKETVVRLFFALLSSRVMPTPQAHSKRELLLSWLPARLPEIKSLAFLPSAVLHDVVMHCSYADLAEKHQIKREINRLIETELLNSPVLSELLPIKPPPPYRQKPELVIVLEWFSSQHSIYRTHSSTMRALRKHFHVVGVAQSGASDSPAQQVFDEFIEISAGTAVYDVIKLLSARRPDVVYYPSVGMFPLTIYLINLRLAPLQLMALGHPATTWSPYIDGVLVEEDYLGDADCFSEKIIQIPKDAMPYLAPERTQRIVVQRQPFSERTADAIPFQLPVRVAVCASVMKINPGFLQTLAEISRHSRQPVQFCFYLGFSHGLTQDYLRTAITSVLPDAEVNAHMPVQTYQQALNSCELFINPFPFGNTNGLVDTVRQGLPGVCMSGPEVHTHIDEGLFRRLGLPEELITKNQEQYIQASIRLIEDHLWREELQKQLQDNDVEQVLFKGYPEKFAAIVYRVYNQQQENT